MIFYYFIIKIIVKIMALIAIGTIGTALIAEKTIGASFSFFTNKNRREEIRLLQENWDALFTKNEMLKEYLKNTLLPNITKAQKLLNELVIFQNQLLIGNGEESMFYLGSDKVRSILLETLKEMREFFKENVNFYGTLDYSDKNPREYLKDSREEYAKCTEGTGILNKVILYHLEGINCIIKQANFEELVSAEIYAQISAMKDSPKTVLDNYRKGYDILTEMIETYENIEYLITPVNGKLIIKQFDHNSILDMGYFDMLHFGIFVSKFNNYFRNIKAKYIFHNGERILREHSLVFESSSAFTFSKESTFRTILGFEEDIESIEEDGKHIIRFNNVKQIHKLETLRTEKKAARLNALIQRFIIFKEKFGFI